MSNHFDDKLLLIEKFNSEKVFTSIYLEGKSGAHYLKRFVFENASIGKKTSIISEEKGSKLILISGHVQPKIRLEVLKGKTKIAEESEIDLSEAIEVKGMKAMGNRLSPHEVKEINLLPSTAEDDEEMQLDLNQLDDSELATEILRRRLVTTMAQPVVVGNISAGSWGSPNMLAYAREFGLFDADLVLIVLSSHDSCDVPTFGPLDPNTHPTHAPMSALFEAVTRYLPRYLPSFGTGTDQPLSVPACDGVDLQTSLDALSAALRLFKTQTPHVLLILHSTQSELSKRANHTGNHLLAELAHREKVPVFQLGARFSSAIAAGDNPYRDDIHLSATGQRLLADVMYEQVDQIAGPTNENR